ncbi:MAG: response regulator transcription factor [Planctomycetaceae bacterium]
MNSVVLVEDDLVLSQVISEYLTAHDFRVRAVSSGRAAMELIQQEPPSIVVLDVNLPDIDGFSLCLRLRENYHGAIVIVTARATDGDEILGLDCGADDYIVKPVRPAVLLARLRSHRRQKYDIDSSDPGLQIGHLLVFPIRRTCQIGDRQLALSGNEFELLMHLIKHAGQRISREELHKLVIPEPWSPSDRNIDLRISRLRQKLGSPETSGLQIRSVRSVGYELVQHT